MSSSPRPHYLSLGRLESEIMGILWEQGSATVKQIHDQILQDPDRELAYASVTTVLQRLQRKGWVRADRSQRSFIWQPCLTRAEAQSWRALDQLRQFLAVGTPDAVAAFADRLDGDSIDQLQAIADKLKAARQLKELKLKELKEREDPQ